ncbi:MAG TPA: hypothetical protein VFZ83_03780 [Acidimicrobiia bacterium]|nr:hypothetical protein [Acidimicrobiia bacterium]
MKRVLLFVFGGIAALTAIGLVVGGIALLALFGRDGWFDSSRKEVATDTYALISDPVEIEDELPTGSSFDIRIRLRADAIGGSGDVFVGVAESADVDRYLAGVPHEVVTDVQWGERELQTDRVDGTSEPDPPGAESFWVASTSGSDRRTLDWELEQGSYRFVVMNADGSAGIDVRMRLGARVPFAYPLAIGFLIAAAVLALVAILLIVFGVRSRPAPVTGPPPAPWGSSEPSAAAPGSNEPAPSAAWRPPDQTP